MITVDMADSQTWRGASLTVQGDRGRFSASCGFKLPEEILHICPSATNGPNELSPTEWTEGTARHLSELGKTAFMNEYLCTSVLTDTFSCV